MYLETSIEQVVGGLIDADVRFESAKDNLFDAQFFELCDERLSSARAKRCFFKYFKVVGNNELYLFCGAAQPFGILLGHKHRNTEDLKTANRDRCPRRHHREGRDDVTKRFLNIDDDE